MTPIIGHPTKQSQLLEALQEIEIIQFGIHQRYHPSEATNLIELANEMAADPGDVTVILVRTL